MTTTTTTGTAEIGIEVSTLTRLCSSGDVLLVKGLWPIRMITGETISHLGMIVRNGDKIEVCEYIARGFRKLPLEHWFAKQKKSVLWGAAPRIVHDNPILVATAARRYGYRSYNFLEAIQIVLNTTFGWHLGGEGRTCATYVQECWEEAGWNDRFGETMDPGDFLLEVDILRQVKYA